jgi:uncharacterized protein
MDYFDTSKIHSFKQGNLNIVLDINSGSVHLVDESTFTVLKALEEAKGCWHTAADMVEPDLGPEVLAEIKGELQELSNENVLFTEDDGKVPAADDKPIVKSLCLHLAHDCNLRCNYCFASSGSFGGQKLLMDLETGKKAIDFLLKQLGSRKTCEVDFFGGEPLMNFEVMKQLVAYGRERSAQANKVINFTLTTNGVLLSQEVEKFLNSENISVVLSLDGRKEVNDRMRPQANGKGSYDVIVPIYQRFAASRGDQDYIVRGTYTHFNTDFAQDVKEMFEQGFTHLSVEPVVAPAEEPYALTSRDLEDIYEEYDKLSQWYLEEYRQGREVDFFHFNVDLDKGPCLPKRLTGCGAGYEYLAVTPEGDLYPCHQFVGQAEYIIGNVDQGLKRPEIGLKFKEAHIYNKEECSTCWARFLCSGGCHANAYANNKDIFKPYEIGCQIQKKRLECAIYVQVAKKLAAESKGEII